MNTTFGCTCCGRPMPLTFREGLTEVRCPHCGKRVKIPASLAAMPRPRVDADLVEGCPLEEAELAAACGQADYADDAEPAIARAMPWVLSSLLHVGLCVIMIFLAMVIPTKTDADPPNPPSVSVARIKPRRQFRTQSLDTLQKPSLGGGRQDTWKKPPKTDEPEKLVSHPGKMTLVDLLRRPSGDNVRFDKPTSTGPEVDLFPPVGPEIIDDPIDDGQPADHVVFVIDRSGSMVGTFDTVRLAMYMYVSEMAADQDFHVVLFAAGNVEENPPRRLVRATPDAKIQLVDFLKGIRPGDQTDPLPALRRGFAVLNGAKKPDGTEGVKLMYLLTDGEFRQSDKVVEAVRQMNAAKDGPRVHINTILYGARSPQAAKVMKLIAKENKGRYTYASPE